MMMQQPQPNPFGHNPDPSLRTQFVRIIDVVALGPALIVAAMQAKELPILMRWFIGISGAATITFNGYNLIKAADQRGRGAPRALPPAR